MVYKTEIQPIFSYSLLTLFISHYFVCFSINYQPIYGDIELVLINEVIILSKFTAMISINF